MRNIMQDAVKILKFFTPCNIIDGSAILPQDPEIECTIMDVRKRDKLWFASCRWQLFEISKEYKVTGPILVALWPKTPVTGVICKTEYFRHRIPYAQASFHQQKQCTQSLKVQG